jgi:hypothetical protein
MKVKVFGISTLKGFGGIEAEINSWLSANQNIKLKYVNFGVLSGDPGTGESDSVMVLVFYEGELAEGKLVAEGKLFAEGE